MITDISTSHVKDNPLMAEISDGTGSTFTTDALTPEEQINPDVNEDNIEISKNGNETDIDIPAYTVRGELGSLITNELNELFKNTDNTVALKNVPVLKLHVDGSREIRTTEEGYIYASDLKHINESGVTAFVDRVLNSSLEGYKDKICYIDLNESPKGNIDLALDILSFNGVSVVFTKEKLIEHLHNDKA